MTKEEEIIEIMADVEHDRWAKWQKHVHDKCELRPDGLLIPNSLVERWEEQYRTPYIALSEEDREKDRREARVTIKALNNEGFEII